MEEKFQIRTTKLLAVEGKDECNFFVALLNHENITDVQLVDIGGKEKFKIELPLLMKLDGFRHIEAIGFIRDAEDQEAEAAFKSLCETLIKNNLPAPVSLKMIARGKPTTGIFIMPDNYGSGRIEDLCLKSLAGMKIADCINDYVSCFTYIIDHSEKKEKFNESKAKVLTYLASRAPIVNSLGLAALNHYWDFSHKCFDELKRFLHDLF